MNNPPKVLVAALDWGLGHATRCVPIIRSLMQSGVSVSVASSGSALALLKSEFPLLSFHELTAYQVNYSKRIGFMFNIFGQVPRLLYVIKQEHRELEGLVKTEGFNVVISDNRYGCWTRLAKTVFITHQLHILIPLALKWAEPVINLFNRRQIKRFDYCWIPDLPGSVLTGRLSQSRLAKVRFVGLLSRFNRSTNAPVKKYYCVGIVSGPEPQRMILEQMLRREFQQLKRPCALVRGMPTVKSSWIQFGLISEVSHLSSAEMQHVIEQSEWVISRSGYSTVMDLTMIGGRAIFIPTPGQTEQEYLAKKLERMGVSYYQNQKDFNLSLALSSAERYAGFDVITQELNLLDHAIKQLIHGLD